MPTFTQGQAVKDLRKPRTGTITAVEGARITVQWSDGREQNYVAATYGTLFDLDDTPPKRKPKKAAKKSARKKAKKAKRKRT